MLKILMKIATDILPSVVATVVGAYIVSHYINARPAADTPVAATSATSAVDDPQTVSAGANKAAKPDPVYEPGVAAKGISEKAMMEKTAAEGPVEVKPLEAKVPEGRPTETASAPAPAPPHHQLAPHEKRPAKAAAVVANGPAAPAESAEDHRSAVELAKAAIARLRGSSEKEPPRPAPTSPVRPLPPPITVTMPGLDPSYPHLAPARADDPDRPIPPADIPRPPELRVDAGPAPSPRDNASNLADDMLTAAKAMFHVVLPPQSKLSD